MGLRRRAGEPLNIFDWSDRHRGDQHCCMCHNYSISQLVSSSIPQFLNSSIPQFLNYSITQYPNDQINVSHEVIVPLVGKEIVNEEMVNSLPFAKLLLSLHAECV